MKEVAAILLAAGRSERMRAFKPLLPFGSKTVVEACIDYLREGGIETIIVVVGHRAQELRERLKGASVMFASNPDPTSEMNTSIACGVSQLPEEIRATIVALVDHPAIRADVVETLQSEWRNGARLVIPTFGGRGGHPVLVDLSLRKEILSLDPMRGLKALFEVHREEVKRVSVDSPFVARDMDTWDDYRALYQEVFNMQPPEFHR